ncbi:glycoside hydrolase family 43 protein [Microbacterium murale]|uniref:Xylan 1,4-beta-xylosidase n=1 Tax=Microbacterium murale TaxID=1081040 RepID=A0ABU0PDB6_9MICO|nr:glycoside hydrolase family 43 protein [Microbacterium murale]MDQ0644619.1 xylan 1,4-beta-xylosidase [Microbacterium murale]
MPNDRQPAAPTALVDAARHPIIPGFYPDPTICRVGDDHYIAQSSFEYSPGVPLWHSSDLLEWRQVGHALDGDPLFPAGRARASGGVYAPTLRHHDGRFWMITTDVSGDAGQLLTTAPAIEGPWGPALLIEGIRGIDPDIAWDDRGNCYVTFSSNDPRVTGIGQVRIDPERGIALEDPRPITRGTGLAHPEAPHLFRRGDWWYLLYAEGGTERGHCVSVGRSASPTGPFELFDGNPIFTRRSTVFPVQNAGHGDLVERADGTWAMVYLGVRPHGGTPLYHVNGRETFLAGVDWQDDWPVVVPDRFRIPPPETAFTDRFDQPDLDVRWVSPGAAPDAIAIPLPGGGIEIRPDAITDAGQAEAAPSLLAVRARDRTWRFEADASGLDGAALRVRMDDRHWAELRLVDGHAEVELAIGPVRQVLAISQPLAAPVTLRTEAVDGTFGGPDDLVFSVADAAGEQELVRIDGRYLSTEVASGFVGRVIGLRATISPVRFAEVRYAPTAHSAH